MDKTPLYQQIAEAVRQDILYGSLPHGAQLPSVREMAQRWRCTVGTVQRAYAELGREGLVMSRSGQGTRVVKAPAARAISQAPLRRAALVNQAERFLLEMLAAGHATDEVEQAMRAAVDRWRVVEQAPPESALGELRFVGSHDPAIALIAERFDAIAPGSSLRVSYAGSLGGLMALARGEADLAGCHLWDAECDCYNTPFVQHLLPGRRVALLTLAERRLGLIVPAGNPAHVRDLVDVVQGALRFVNRQSGAGTRVWLDAQLRRQGVDSARVQGYQHEVATHSAVAEEIVAGRADVGLGVEAAALAYGLGFVALTTERYDLAILAESWRLELVQRLAAWLVTESARAAIAALGGYETTETGIVRWVE
jgi:molybdate-binding protein/DNA-binding transcriptional regulator YhcF (GntR family)